jgi:tetratricopeptide (TPR) repeat protein
MILRSVLAKVLPLLLLLALIAAIVAKATGFRWSHSADISLIDKGKQALARGDLPEAERIAAALEEQLPKASHLLRGKIWAARAKQAHNRARPEPYEEAQEAAQMVLAGAGLAGRPAVVRETAWLSACLVQQPVAVPSEERKFLHQAVTEFAHVRDDGPTGVEASVLAATCLAGLEQRPLAVEVLDAVVKRHPDQKRAHGLLAAIYMDLNVPAAAVQHLRAWGELDTEDGRPYRLIGLLSKDYGGTQDAIKAYEEALRRHLEPGVRAEVIQELAKVLIDTQADAQRALDILDQCPEPSRNDPEILTLRADCLGGLGRWHEAARLLDSILRSQPRLTQALLLRAKIYRNEDGLKDARRLLQQAVAVEPHDGRIRQQLAEVYGQLGEDARAAEQHRLSEEWRAVEEDLGKLTHQAIRQPWDDRIRVMLALLCLKINRTREAAMWAQAAVAANPDNQQARQLLTRLTGRRGASSSRMKDE